MNTGPVRPGGCPVVEDSGRFDALLQEDRTFPPPEEFTANANISDPRVYEEAATAPESFWAKFADELDWFKKWDTVLDWNPPYAKWFIGGKLNVSYNCIDQHLSTWRRNKAASIWEGEPGDTRTLTYQQLHDEVCRFANGLKSLGVEQGDVISIYMPMVPELAIAMLACARIGAVHSVIFGGFSSEAIADRNQDASAKVVITADAGWRRGKQLPLKASVDDALEKSPTVEHCVVLQRGGNEVTMREGRDHWWHDLVDQASRRLAQTVLASQATDDSERIDRLCEHVLGRPATASDLRRCSRFLERIRGALPENSQPTDAWSALCHVLLASNEFIYLK